MARRSLHTRRLRASRTSLIWRHRNPPPPARAARRDRTPRAPRAGCGRGNAAGCSPRLPPPRRRKDCSSATATKSAMSTGATFRKRRGRHRGVACAGARGLLGRRIVLGVGVAQVVLDPGVTVARSDLREIDRGFDRFALAEEQLPLSPRGSFQQASSRRVVGVTSTYPPCRQRSTRSRMRLISVFGLIRSSVHLDVRRDAAVIELEVPYGAPRRGNSGSGFRW